MGKGRSKPGPKADRLKVEGPWGKALGRAIQKPRPKRGWPKPPKRKEPP